MWRLAERSFNWIAGLLLALALLTGFGASLHVGYAELGFFGVLLAFPFFWIGTFVAPFYVWLALGDPVSVAWFAGLLAAAGVAAALAIAARAIANRG